MGSIILLLLIGLHVGLPIYVGKRRGAKAGWIALGILVGAEVLIAVAVGSFCEVTDRCPSLAQTTLGW